MGLNISSSQGVVTAGTLDINFTEEVSVSDDGDDTVTVKVLDDRIRTNYNNVRDII